MSVASTEQTEMLREMLGQIEGKAEIVNGRIEMELPPGDDIALAWELLGDIPGKIEIVDGRIILEMPTGKEPGMAAGEIFAAIREYARRIGRGRAVGDNVTFNVTLPNRKAFSPDAAYIDEERDGAMGAVQSAPLFAVEVRSENDYGPAQRACNARQNRGLFRRRNARGVGRGLAKRKRRHTLPRAQSRRSANIPGAAKSPTRAPRCRVGRWPLTRFSREQRRPDFVRPTSAKSPLSHRR